MTSTCFEVQGTHVRERSGLQVLRHEEPELPLQWVVAKWLGGRYAETMDGAHLVELVPGHVLGVAGEVEQRAAGVRLQEDVLHQLHGSRGHGVAAPDYLGEVADLAP